MSKPPPLSVVMPVHDALPYLREALESILTQSFSDFEFVIGDDGSTDGSSELLRDYAARDRRIRLVIRQEKSGPTDSANWVVRNSRAPIVARMDADDVSLPGRLETQLRVLQRNDDVVLVGSLFEGIDESGRLIRHVDAWRLEHHNGFAPFPHASIMFRRSSFDAVGGYRSEAQFWEDLDLYYRLERLGRVEVLVEPFLRLRHSESSTRLRNDQLSVARAQDNMFKAADLHRLGRSYEHLLTGPQAASGLDPRTFVSRGATRVWTGKRPGPLPSMLRSARLRPDVRTARSLLWLLLATLSPRACRLAIDTILRARSKLFEAKLRGKESVTWVPSRGRQPRP